MNDYILLVAPYENLARVAKNNMDKLDTSFSIIVSNLEDNIREVERIIKRDNIKVIVSRGGTAERLQERFSLPVVEIPITSSDILNAINSVTGKGYHNIVVISTANLIFKNEHFDIFHDISVKFEPCNNISEIPHKVEELLVSDADAVIGDVTAIKEARKYGIYAKLLESGYESISIAMKEAKKILQAELIELTHQKELENILNSISEAVMATDKNKIVTVCNRPAEKLFGKNSERILGKKLDKLFNGIATAVESPGKRILEINGNKVVSETIPINVDGTFQGSVLILQRIRDIQNLELNVRQQSSQRKLSAKYTFNDIIYTSNEMNNVVNRSKQYAGTEANILIMGETGTGKEMFAQSIHNFSKRASMPFVAINCASLSESLLESELFGYEEGAFTGASKGGRAGLFEIAHRGTIFLDEVSETTVTFQAKLLRVIQEREVRRIGSDKVIPIDVRIICATNKNLSEEVAMGNFRKDLYYRINVLKVVIPPLRSREEDIVPLAKYFFYEMCDKYSKYIEIDDMNVFKYIESYPWYGNARELKNFIECLVISCEETTLNDKFVYNMVKERLNEEKVDDEPNKIVLEVSKDIKHMECDMWRKLLELYGGDKEMLCREFGISKATLWRKLNFNNEI